MSRSGDWFIRTYGDDIFDDSEYEIWRAEREIDLLEKRQEAEEYILRSFVKISEETANSCGGNFEDIEDIAQHDLEFHEAIWYASTQILPELEVQVVIDGKNNCFVTTGSAGYVEFGMRPPIGMTLPIRCWIHTHPFGSAYFSGTDIRTVSIWEPNMECAYVLGGIGHSGFWSNRNPKQLEIVRNNEYERTQTWGITDDSEE